MPVHQIKLSIEMELVEPALWVHPLTKCKDSVSSMSEPQSELQPVELERSSHLMVEDAKSAHHTPKPLTQIQDVCQTDVMLLISLLTLLVHVEYVLVELL